MAGEVFSAAQLFRIWSAGKAFNSGQVLTTHSYSVPERYSQLDKNKELKMTETIGCCWLSEIKT